MDIKQLKNLVKGGESQYLEFKKSTANLKGIFQTLCAYLNGDGGILAVGVSDKVELLGQEISDKTKREIGLELAKISPFVDSAIQIFASSSKSVGHRWLR